MTIKNRLEAPLIDHTLDFSPYHQDNDLTEDKKSKDFITDNMRTDFERVLSKYPNEQKQSALIPILTLCQVYNGGHLTESIVQEVAQYLSLEPIKAFEVATFYSLFNHQPQGKYQLCICQGVSCLLNGYKQVLEAIMQKLESQDEAHMENLFSVKKVECLGACGGAPVMMVGDQYYENLSPTSALDLMESLAKK